MNKISKFFHELKNPHCPDCFKEKMDDEFNEVVATLKLENARLIRENERLLNIILDKPVEEKIDTKDLKPIAIHGNRHVPWSVRKQMLEENDRAQAKIIKEREASLNKPVIDDKTQTLEDQIING